MDLFEDWSYLSMNEITVKLFNNKLLSDIEFQVENKTIYAHGFELAKRSRVFREQFHATYGEKKLIPIPNVKYDEFLEFLNFVYCDTCCLSEYNVFAILRLARKYEIFKLEDMIADFLTNCQWELMMPLFNFCVSENYCNLLTVSEARLQLCLKSHLLSDNFLEIGIKTLEKIMKFESVCECTEKDIYDGLIRWTNNYCAQHKIDVNNKRQVIEGIIKLIRFPVMSQEEFANCIAAEPTLLTSSEALSIFMSIATKGVSNEMNFITNKRSLRNMEVKKSVREKVNDAIFSVKENVIIKGFWVNTPQNKHAFFILYDETGSVLKLVGRKPDNLFGCRKVITFHKPIQLVQTKIYKFEIVYLDFNSTEELSVLQKFPQSNVVFYKECDFLLGIIFDE